MAEIFKEKDGEMMPITSSELLKDKDVLMVGNRSLTRSLVLPVNDGSFDSVDLNDFGYPKNVKDSGEFRYWYPRNNERAAIRNWYSELGLSLGREPGFVLDRLGVRLAKKFFSGS